MTAVFRAARWLCDPEFRDLIPRPVLHPARRKPEPAPAPHRTDLRHRHLLVRRDFTLATVPVVSQLRITADDYYRLWINGTFIGQGPAPGYPQHYYVNTWDITAHLRPGANLIAVQVYYQGLVNRVWTSGDYRQGLAVELLAGDEVLLASDASWRCRVAREFTGTDTIGYETQFLEHIDSRLALPGWREPGFDDHDWDHLTEKSVHDYRFVLQPTPAVAVYRQDPATLTTVAPGHYRIDFGHEITGALTMRAHGPAGTTIELRCGEELTPTGEVRDAMRCNCTYRETWTLSGRPHDELEHFDYKAFRYAEIVAPDGVVDLASIAAIVRHYPVGPDAARFACSVPLVERIWDICRVGVTMGAQEGFLDCPSREKGQYLGDITIAGHAHLYLSGDPRLSAKALVDFAQSTAICPGLMAVAPGSFMQEIADFSLQWPLHLWRYYQHTGDRATLVALAPVADGILDHFRRWRRADGLLTDVDAKWNLVDWPANLRDDYDHELPDPPAPGIHNVINAFFHGALLMVNRIHAALGQPVYEDPVPFAAAFRAAFHRADGLFADTPISQHRSLHANAVALFAGLVAPADVPAVIAHLRAKRFSCGVYMAYFVLRGLAANGAHDLVWELITGSDEHSWSTMVGEGASSCFEAWGKDQKWNTSLCHPWASSPVPVLVEDLLGLTPAEPGWTRIAFRPRLPAGIAHLRLELTVPSGRLIVEHRAGTTTLTAPPGVVIDRG